MYYLIEIEFSEKMELSYIKNIFFLHINHLLIKVDIMRTFSSTMSSFMYFDLCAWNVTHILYAKLQRTCYLPMLIVKIKNK